MHPRPYQAEALQALHSSIVKRKGNPLIVAPTGSGKSFIIAEYLRGMLSSYPKLRILVLSHTSEILEQDAKELFGIWKEAPLALFGASLGSRKLSRATFAMIQSFHSSFKDSFVSEAPFFDLVIVDEAHLIPHKTEGRYREILSLLEQRNPNLVVIGLTATPLRMKGGSLISEENIFDHIAFNISIERLISEGYLCPLTSKSSATQADLANVRIRAGEFKTSDLVEAINQDPLTDAAIKECIEKGADRKSWLFFGCSIEHIEAISARLKAFGIDSRCVSSKTPRKERKAIIKAFKKHEFKALVNCDLLTTGFNAPGVDLIALLRATRSVPLYMQILGRGMRTAPGKDNCLVLDFAGNLERHGPINCISFLGDQVKKKPGYLCLGCREYFDRELEECPACGLKKVEEEASPGAGGGPRSTDHDTQASEAQVISEPERFGIRQTEYSLYKTKPGKLCLLAKHLAFNGMVFYDYVLFDHEGYPREKANLFWANLAEGDARYKIPKDSSEALERVDQLKPLKEIVAKKDGKYWTILSRVPLNPKEMKERETSVEDALEEGFI